MNPFKRINPHYWYKGSCYTPDCQLLLPSDTPRVQSTDLICTNINLTIKYTMVWFIAMFRFRLYGGSWMEIDANKRKWIEMLQDYCHYFQFPNIMNGLSYNENIIIITIFMKTDLQLFLISYYYFRFFVCLFLFLFFFITANIDLF